MRTSADAFPVVGGRCTGRARRCKAKQGRREDGTDVWILTSTVVRFWGRVKSGEDFFGNQARPLPAHCRNRSRALQRQTEHRCVSGELEFRIRVVTASSFPLASPRKFHPILSARTMGVSSSVRNPETRSARAM
jgi:hypothetical protein